VQADEITCPLPARRKLDPVYGNMFLAACEPQHDVTRKSSLERRINQLLQQSPVPPCKSVSESRLLISSSKKEEEEEEVYRPRGLDHPVFMQFTRSNTSSSHTSSSHQIGDSLPTSDYKYLYCIQTDTISPWPGCCPWLPKTPSRFLYFVTVTVA